MQEYKLLCNFITISEENIFPRRKLTKRWTVNSRAQALWVKTVSANMGWSLPLTPPKPQAQRAQTGCKSRHEGDEDRQDQEVARSRNHTDCMVRQPRTCQEQHQNYTRCPSRYTGAEPQQNWGKNRIGFVNPYLFLYEAYQSNKGKNGLTAFYPILPYLKFESLFSYGRTPRSLDQQQPESFDDLG